MRTHEESALYEFIGKRIAGFRRRPPRRISQGELARQVNLSRTSIVNIESGRHRIQIHVLYAIARVLAVDPRRHLLPPLGVAAGEDDFPRGLEKQLEKELGRVTVEAKAQVAALVSAKTSRAGRG